MLGKGAVDDLFILRKLQEYREKDKNLYMCNVDLEKAFDRVLSRCTGSDGKNSYESMKK